MRARKLPNSFGNAGRQNIIIQQLVAGFATSQAHSRERDPNHVLRQGCRYAARASPSSIEATARVIFRVTKVSPRIGLRD